MKANEIQIGDFVLYSNALAKVVEVNDMSKTAWFKVRATVKDDVKALEPITLTNEFFEKNGFKKTKDEKYCMCDDYCELSAEEYSDSIWLICCSDIECNLPVQKIMVSYVHQLQQFLRLCGEENMANSLKV